ncbi:MAG: hypothetical protein CBD64_03250 [Flavobacteriaceae bacterium TMED204]|jgi:hypothetical protein|nr:hypothetical protein [Flavobacteriaceae bacterium]MCH1608681.1 hypothetical protein [Flavobacteriaceae bacterium]MDG1968727.1 hypothetical protein [Flavobacteriaceae bacterium]OUW74316.1 MAG: hypothetical protein CBD64_03250 [Flavobacteriaceae bacterium TMED204]HCZ10113.1 hypothetical protein [Flavobacteriaceae bacterium]|tara:strand:- start:2644 stop:2853 length:210 start_codon:yes stop_codon:yes gene_type:complete
MIKKNKKFGFLLLLIPLGIVIRYIDRKVTQDGFLSTNAISDHYLFISGLVVVVIVLLSVILYFDKKSNP